MKLDPGYARAWAGLAIAHRAGRPGRTLPVDEGYRKARQEVEKRSSSIRTWPRLTRPWAGYGHTYDWDWSGADAAYKRALELEPGNAKVVRRAAGLAATLGRFDEAIV